MWLIVGRVGGAERRFAHKLLSRCSVVLPAITLTRSMSLAVRRGARSRSSSTSSLVFAPKQLCGRYCRTLPQRRSPSARDEQVELTERRMHVGGQTLAPAPFDWLDPAVFVHGDRSRRAWHGGKVVEAPRLDLGDGGGSASVEVAKTSSSYCEQSMRSGIHSAVELDHAMGRRDRRFVVARFEGRARVCGERVPGVGPPRGGVLIVRGGRRSRPVGARANP